MPHTFAFEDGVVTQVWLDKPMSELAPEGTPGIAETELAVVPGQLYDGSDPVNPPRDLTVEKRRTSRRAELAISEFRQALAGRVAYQAEAYLEAETVARRIVAGSGTADDLAFLTERDVDLGTVNPLTALPVATPEEAAQVIVAVADTWRGMLRQSDTIRRRALVGIDAAGSVDGVRAALDTLTTELAALAAA